MRVAQQKCSLSQHQQSRKITDITHRPLKLLPTCRHQTCLQCPPPKDHGPDCPPAWLWIESSQLMVSSHTPGAVNAAVSAPDCCSYLCCATPAAQVLTPPGHGYFCHSGPNGHYNSGHREHCHLVPSLKHETGFCFILTPHNNIHIS